MKHHILIVKLQPWAIDKSVMYIFMLGCGYGKIGPAMLVYRETTTLVIAEHASRIFIPRKMAADSLIQPFWFTASPELLEKSYSTLC